MAPTTSFVILMVTVFCVLAIFQFYIQSNYPGAEIQGGVFGAFCSDSDNGNNIYTQGRCLSLRNSGTDTCNSDGTLTEYYCSKSKGNPQCLSTTVNCPTGYACQNGACVQTSGGVISTTTTTSGPTYTTTTTMTTTTAPAVPSMLPAVAVGSINSQKALMTKNASIQFVRADVTFDTTFQNIYSLSNSNSLKLIGILDYQTLNYNSSFTLTDWNNTVKKAQQTYPTIHVWEIWNEPTLSKYQLGYMDGTPQHYLVLLQSAYSILKTGDPAAIVLGIGGAQFGVSKDRNFTASVFYLGGGNYMDGLSFHAYPYNLNIGQTWGYYQDIWTQDIQYYSQFGKPLWLTETGLQSTQNSEADQTIYLNESYNFFKQNGMKSYTWYQLNDYYSNITLKAWGILRTDYTAKPSYYTYQTLIVSQ